MSIGLEALLYKVMRDRMSEADLQRLYFNFIQELDYDNLEGGSKDAKARSLITYFMHRKRLPELTDALLQMRPDLRGELEVRSGAESKRVAVSDWMKDWLFLQLFIPLVILLIPFVADVIVVQREHPFQITFSDGDLMLFSAMLLIGFSIHTKQMHLQWRASISDSWFSLPQAAGVVLLLLFVMLEYDVIHKGYFNLDVGVLPKRVTAYSCFSCSAALISIMFSVIKFRKLTRLLLKETMGY